MKKTYNAPVLNIIEVQSTMLAGSLGADTSTPTNSQLSKKFNISFEDDEEDMSYGW